MSCRRGGLPSTTHASDLGNSLMSQNNLQAVAFPKLDEKQIKELERCTDATPKSYRDKQALFSVGERNMNFYIVKSGEIEIVDYTGDEPKTIVIHHQGEFT